MLRTFLALLVLASAATALVPSASAERVTGCLDGDFRGSDCFVGDYLPVCVRECVPRPDCGWPAENVRECDPPA